MGGEKGKGKNGGLYKKRKLDIDGKKGERLPTEKQVFTSPGERGKGWWKKTGGALGDDLWSRRCTDLAVGRKRKTLIITLCRQGGSDPSWWEKRTGALKR